MAAEIAAQSRLQQLCILFHFFTCDAMPQTPAFACSDIGRVIASHTKTHRGREREVRSRKGDTCVCPLALVNHHRGQEKLKEGQNGLGRDH